MIQICKTERIFKENLVKLRLANKLSKYRISQKTGIHYSYYCRLEDMDIPVSPTLQTMEILAVFYGLEVSDLFHTKDEAVSPE